MGYCTRQELIEALANALSQGNPTTPGTLVDITHVGKMVTDTVTDTQVFQYIRWADENIDAALSGMYQTPLTRINRGSFKVASDVTAAADTFVLLEDSSRFSPGDVVLIRDDINSQQLTIDDVPSEIRLDFTTPITDSYSALTTRVERIRFPDPIPKMSARMAAAYLYDKHFAAQVEGNESNYGKYLRNLAMQDMNAILGGVIRLDIPDAGNYKGRRYYNAALDDVINTRAKPGEQWFQQGT